MSRWLALLPEAVLAITAVAILFGSGSRDARRPGRARSLAVWGGVVALVLVGATLGVSDEVFSTAYRVDAFSQPVKLAVLVGFLLGAGVVSGDAPPGDLFFFFLLVAAAALAAMASTVEAVALYLALELFSLALAALVRLENGDTLAGPATRRLITLGLASSGVTLYGLSLLVGLTGTTSLAEMAVEFAELGSEPAAAAGLLLFLSGFVYKLAVFPFHAWAPEVFASASPGAAAFAATAGAVAATGVVLRLASVAGAGGLGLAIGVLAVASVSLGSMRAIGERDVKRLLGHSAVAQSGFLLLGPVAGTPRGLAAALFAAFALLVMHGAAWVVLARVGASGRPVALDELRGLGRRSPLLAATFLVALLALAGVPATAGFASRWYLFSATLAEGGGVGGVLVGLGTAGSLVILYAFLPALKAMYLAPNQPRASLALSAADRRLCWALTAAILLAGCYPPLLYRWAERAVQFLP